MVSGEPKSSPLTSVAATNTLHAFSGLHSSLSERQRHATKLEVRVLGGDVVQRRHMDEWVPRGRALAPQHRRCGPPFRHAQLRAVSVSLGEGDKRRGCIWVRRSVRVAKLLISLHACAAEGARRWNT
jgi:hypothetical protein